MPTLKDTLQPGEQVKVKVNGELVTGAYDSWSEKYDMAIVVVDGKKIPRKIFNSSEVTATAAPVSTSSVSAGGEIAVKSDRYPPTVGTRCELRRDGHYDIFNSRDVKITELWPHDAGKISRENSP